MYRIGIDTGGTNTDLVLSKMDTGEVFSRKTPTTTYNLIEGIFKGLDEICQEANIQPEEIKELIYGTTIVVNMIAQKESENVALITTKGFKDVLEIGRAWRDKQIYNNFLDKEKPLVQRELRFEVSERMNFKGEVLEPLNIADLDEIIQIIKQKNIRAVAVCLIHAYKNPVHEQMIKARLLEALPDLYVSISAEVNPQFREYERTSTTVINAYMMPNMVSHLNEFNERLKKQNMSPVTYMMNANAGVMSFASALQKPVSVSESGPIGGIIAANYLGQLMGEKNLITFDMGGTSCDVALIQNNEISFCMDSEIEGYPINIPTVDLDYIGAGGGSIAWCDQGGVLKVGPKSAGAYPGPICYQRGGEEPTVTDANLILGRIRPEMFLEDISSALEKTKDLLTEKIAKPLGLDLYQASEGIIEVINANMLRAIKLVSVQRGHDPSEFSLVAFGGAGGLHAAKIAEELKIPKVIIPPSPGTFAAMGQILADIKHDFVFTHLQNIEQADITALNQIYNKLEKEGLEQLAREGVDTAQQLLIRSCDVRYLGQAYELNIELPNKPLTIGDIEHLQEKFHQLHESIYGHALREDPIELVNYRVSAIGKIEKPNLHKQVSVDKVLTVVPTFTGKVIFDGREYQVPIYDRASLPVGYKLSEPAIIGEMGATTVIYPGQSAVIDQFGSIIINTSI